MPPTTIVADRRDSGNTLAAVLKTRLGLSWAHAKRVIDRRHVRVGGMIVADPTYRVKAGKRISIAAGAVELPKPVGEAKPPQPKPTPPPPKPKSQPKPAVPSTRYPIPVVLYSDDEIVVADKPAGLTTMRHADEAAEFGVGKGRFLPKTLADLLPPLLGDPGRPVIAVHRIDRDTSGVVVFARTPAAAKSLTDQFRKHTADRRYLALVRGTPANGRLESTFVDDRGDGRRGSGPGGKKAVTYVAVRETFDGFAVVECRLETGRTHQVRIHLGEAGTPLCGETVYDRPPHGRPLPDASGAARPMLHAARLGFVHPTTGEDRTWEVPPPKDFQELLTKLRAARGERGASAP